jgi:hypothetical protein
MENPNFILIDDDKIMLFLIEFEIKKHLTIVPKAILNLMSLLILFMTTLVS